MFSFEPGFGTEFLTPEKIQNASFIPPCMFQVSAGIPYLPGAIPSFTARVDGIQQFFEFMFFLKACNFYGSANRTIPGNASAKQVSTTSVYAFPWNNCEFAQFTPPLGSALMFLPEKGLFGGSFPKQRLVIKPNCESKLFELRGSQGLSFFELLSAKQLQNRLLLILNRC